MLAAYWRGRSIVDARLPPGAMAAVGLSWEAASARCPPDIAPACHNAADSVTVRAAPCYLLLPPVSHHYRLCLCLLRH